MGYKMGVTYMLMYCGVVWGIGWVLHVYVLWCGVGYRMGVYMFMYCRVVWGIEWVLHVYVLWSGVGYRMGLVWFGLLEFNVSLSQ